MNAETLAIAAIVAQIKPLLAGKPPDMQGAVLADLLAIWLAGHTVTGDQAATNELREDVLGMHLTQMRPLIAVNAKIMGLPG
jgi:hypothetical protein